MLVSRHHHRVAETLSFLDALAPATQHDPSITPSSTPPLMFIWWVLVLATQPLSSLSPTPASPFPLLLLYTVYFFFVFNLTYNSRWTSSLPSCLWSQRIFPSLPGSRHTIFYRDASSALLQLVNQWLNFPYSRSNAFRYERKNTNPTLERIELTTSALADVQVNY